MVHIAKQQDGGYMILDATRAGPYEAESIATPGPTTVTSDEELRTALTAFGFFTDQEIEGAIAKVSQTGDTILHFPRVSRD
jgi:hypothetical protein